MRRVTALGCAVLAGLSLAAAARSARPALPSTGASAPVVPGSWADAQIRVVTAAGLLGSNPAAFDPPIRSRAASSLTPSPPGASRPQYPPIPRRLVTMSELDAQLVDALGLAPAARRIRVAAADAQLAPTSRLGTETVARLLGLRLNHPQGSDDLELLPDAARDARRGGLLASHGRSTLTPGQMTWVDQLSATFMLPALDEWQRAVLAGRSASSATRTSGRAPRRRRRSSGAPRRRAAGSTVPGGFDCSGFVWRVYKTKPFPGAPMLGDILKGRTTYAMSAEVTKPDRIGLADLAARRRDLLRRAAGPSRPRPRSATWASTSASGWFVHSSSAGVTLQPLQGWYTTTFAWARRPLLEAGLTA